MYRFPEIRVLYYTMIHCFFSGFCLTHAASRKAGGQQETTGACPAVNHASLYKNALGRVLCRAFLAAVIMLCEQCPPTCRVGGFYGVGFVSCHCFMVSSAFVLRVNASPSQ